MNIGQGVLDGKNPRYSGKTVVARQMKIEGIKHLGLMKMFKMIAAKTDKA